MTYSRKFAAALATSVCIVAIATPASAQTRAYNVPAGSLKSALDAYARQSGRQVIYKSDEVRSARSPGVKGAMSADAALQALLAGTGFTVRGDASGAVAIVRSAIPSGESQAGNAAADDESVADDERGKAEILVVGSRSQNVDIRRTEDDPQPYVVFDSKEIEKSGAGSLEDFLRMRLPMNTQAESLNQSPTRGTASNISQINLRGLGTAQTLILIDGRRAPRLTVDNSPTFTGLPAFAQADINGIPLSAIDRIEILPSTAGGIYGGGAVGGVINIIRKRQYNGLNLSVGYDGTFRGGGETFRAGLSGGVSLEGGRTQITFSASHQSTRPLYAKDNGLFLRGRTLYDTNDPTHQIAFSGTTPNIASYAGDVLVLDNGTSLNSNHTYIPVGYSGGDGGLALVANAGKYNLGLSNDSAGRYYQLRNSPTMDSLNVNIRRDFSNWLSVYVDVTGSRNNGSSKRVGGLPTVVILPDAPNNPFRNIIRVAYPGGIESDSISTTSALSATGGVIAKLGRGWSATAEYQWSRASSKDEANAYPLTSAADAAFLNGNLNVVRDVGAFPIDLTPYLNPAPNYIRGPVKTYQEIGSLRVSGGLLDLPGGKITLTGLLERRSERLSEIYTRQSPSGQTSTLYYPPRRQTVSSEYVELRAPLISERNRVPLVSTLELQASVRHDRYDTRFATPGSVSIAGANPTLPNFTFATEPLGSTDYTIAARWAPVRGITLRSSYSTGFLPPSIGQLAATASPVQSGQSVGFRDPLRKNEFILGPLTLTSGGNPDLLPETSRSFSAGVVLEPKFLKGFRASVDYTDIRKLDEISSTSTATLIANENAYPGRVTREALTASDQAAGYTAGRVIGINTSLLNVAHSEVKAIDFQADYDFRITGIGDFHFYSVATHQFRFRRQLLPTSPQFDSAGFVDGPLKWRGNLGLDWRLGAWNAGWNLQYYDGYSVSFANPSSTSVNATAIKLQGSGRIPAQSYQDVYVSYKFGSNRRSVLSNLELSLGIQNIFDKQPPVIASAVGPGFSPYGDARLRRFSLRLVKHFGN